MKQRIKNLDTFRAIAALVVLVGHIEWFRWQLLGSDMFSKVPSGHTAVMMFFVISGFLITFLLVKEKEKYETISLKDFYLRRILRIWPVYYLVLFISFFFYEQTPSIGTITFNVAMIPNIGRLFDGRWATSPQIWSIGVENMFYVLFPLILLFVPKKRILLLLMTLTAGLTILPHVIDYINVRTLRNESLSLLNNRFFYLNRFDSLFIGCIIGFAFAENHTILKILYNKWLFFVCSAIAVVMWGGHIAAKYFNDEIMSVLFAVVILNVCTNPNMNIRFENRLTQFLGKISYGIYMYHWIVLLLAFRLLPLTNTVGSIVLLYGFTFVVTIAVAWLSYETYEKFFLNLKQRFER